MASPIVARTGRRIALGSGALAPPAAGGGGGIAAGAESVRFAIVLVDLGARGVDAAVVALLAAAAAVAARSPLRVRISSYFLGLRDCDRCVVSYGDGDWIFECAWCWRLVVGDWMEGWVGW